MAYVDLEKLEFDPENAVSGPDAEFWRPLLAGPYNMSDETPIHPLELIEPSAHAPVRLIGHVAFLD